MCKCFVPSPSTHPIFFFFIIFNFFLSFLSFFLFCISCTDIFFCFFLFFLLKKITIYFYFSWWFCTRRKICMWKNAEECEQFTSPIPKNCKFVSTGFCSTISSTRRKWYTNGRWKGIENGLFFQSEQEIVCGLEGSRISIAKTRRQRYLLLVFFSYRN